MGKTVAYVAIAILLGTIAMLPVIALTPKRADEGYYALHGDMRLQGKADVEGLQKLEEVGTMTVPSGPLHVGLMLAFSFVLALGVCLYSKRRMF